MKIYIAGKVSGENPKACAAKFAAAENILKERGYEVVNPIKVVGDFTADWQTAMRKCIAALVKCDAICMLPDCSESKGAKIELEIAIRLGLNLHYIPSTLSPILDPRKSNPFFEL